MPRQPEGKLVAKAIRYITGKGGRCFNIHGGDDPFQEVGIPDVLCCYLGIFVGLEFKQPGEEASKIQKHVLDTIRRAGGIAETVHNMDEVKRALMKAERRRR